MAPVSPSNEEVHHVNSNGNGSSEVASLNNRTESSREPPLPSYSPLTGLAPDSIFSWILLKIIDFSGRQINDRLSGKILVLLETPPLHFRKKIVDFIGGQINYLPLTSGKILLSFGPSSTSLLGPLKGFFELTLLPFKDPQPRVLHCFWNYRYSRAPSGVDSLAWRSQDTVKNNWSMFVVENTTLTLVCKKKPKWISDQTIDSSQLLWITQATIMNLAKALQPCQGKVDQI